MPDRFTLAPFEFFVQRTRTRFPFRYGIASMTEVPHLFVRTRVTVGKESTFGLTSEGLPPKWFTKNPTTTFEQDLPELLEVISHAAKLAEQIAQSPLTFFDFWRELYRQQSEWAKSRLEPLNLVGTRSTASQTLSQKNGDAGGTRPYQMRGGIAPLLANLGVSLVERAVLDGLCRLAGQPVHRMIATNRLGLRLGEIYAELGGAQPHHLLPTKPLDACFVRHTVGLGDALTPADIPANERVEDGLPQDVESSIRGYGLRYFKVKIFGDPARDLPRLRDLSRLLQRTIGGDFFVTLDGNENFKSFAAFREFWQSASFDPDLRELWRHIIVVEQPVHRDLALADERGATLHHWTDRPPLIIDESEGALGDLPRALALGYAGTSYKSCKGIVKGIANACLLEHRRRSGERVVLTGEDLCTLGPVTLLQDVAMMALLGIEHVERNGHHYYRGLSLWPEEWQRATMAAHPDLYAPHPQGFACLQIRDGRLALGSVKAGPLGVQPAFDPSRFPVQPMP
jgi:hypothetical protein